MTGFSRTVLLLAALAALAWLAVGLRAADLEASGADVATGPSTGLTPVRVARAERDLRDANSLTPHRDPDALLARLLRRTGRPAEALRIMRRLVREEPENALYWVGLGFAARELDPALARQAQARVRVLSPIGDPG